MTKQANMRRVRIEHDGSLDAMELRIIDAETEEPLRYVRRVEITADADTRVVSATIFTVGVEIAATIDAEIREEAGLTTTAIEEIVDRVVARLDPRLRRIQRTLEGHALAEGIAPTAPSPPPPTVGLFLSKE